ncbi:hypothetical protein ACFL5O_01810 [Myxococcota bacterium]
MDLVDRIETTRFLGPEFLTWLWHKVELFEGGFELGSLGAAELWFDTQVVLAAWKDYSEQVALRGAAPSSSPEAAEALRQGKVPVKARLRLTVGGEEYVLVFDARTFAISGIKLPEILTENSEERFLERMRLLEQLDQAIGELFDEFLCLRLSSLWESELAVAIRDWVRGKESLTTRAYQGLLRRAQKEAEDNPPRRGARGSKGARAQN